MELLINEIQELMLTDEDNRERQSEKLISVYESASFEQKIQIDKCFICLCGYSLETLIEKRKDDD